MKSSLVLFSIVLFSAAADAESASLPEPAAVRITPAFINELAEAIRTNHPAFLSARARTEAASASVLAVRSWEDPMFRLGGIAGSRSMRSDEGDIVYGVEQKLPLFGKPKYARRVAESEAAVEQATAEFRFQQLRRELAAAIFRTALADRIVEIGTNDIRWLELIAAAAQTRFTQGAATEVDVLKVQTDLAKRVEQLKTDQFLREHERVNLSRILNQDPQKIWPRLELPPLARPVLFNERLVRFALKFEPRIKLMERQVAQADAAVQLARKARLPEIGIGVEARQYSGTGEFREGMVTLNFTIPWWNRTKYTSDRKREEAKLRAVRFDQLDYELGVRNEVHQLTLRIDAARREAILYRDEIIPRSERALTSARAAWEANRGTLRDVLDARRMQLEGELGYERSVAEQYQLMSELVLCCGLGDLEALQMIGAQPDGEPEKTSPK